MLRIARRAAVFAVGISVSLIAVVPAVAAVAPEHVLGGKVTDEGLGYVNAQFITWTGNSKAHPRHYDAFAQLLSGGSPVRLNAHRTEGFPGGFDPGTNTVIYDQQPRGDSDIYLYDLDTQERMRAPDINSRKWEWGAEISTSYILFNRTFKRHRKWHTSLMLYDRTSQMLTTLNTWGAKPFTPTGSIGEATASWSVCGERGCHAFLYDIAGRTTRRIPTSSRHMEYAPVVDETNRDVYYTSSGRKCGQRVGIWRLPIDDFSVVPTQIVDLPDGIDTDWVTTLAPNVVVPSSNDVIFGRWRCRPSEGDIYAARDATSVPDASATGATQRAGGRHEVFDGSRRPDKRQPR